MRKREVFFERTEAIIIFCFIIATLFLLLATKSSPLYPFNNWTDANASITMGKSMMNGLIIYKDIYNQKGPLYYLFYGVAWLISGKDFLGVFIIEVFFFTLLLFFTYKILKLFTYTKTTLFLLPAFAFIMVNSISFAHGGSAEEFVVPLLVISLFYYLRFLKHQYPLRIKSHVLLLNGMIAGCVLWIKFSMLGFWFGWMMMIFFGYILMKEYRFAFKACILFLSGMALVSLPWIIYFGLNSAIGEWLNGYFVINTLSYGEKLPFFERALAILGQLKYILQINPVFTVISVFGAGYIIFSQNIIDTIYKKLAILIPFGILGLAVLGGGLKWPYYFYIVIPFSLFGLISLAILLNDLLDKLKSFSLTFFGSLCFIFFLIIITYFNNHDRFFMAINKDELIQYSFADVIAENPNATLLNFGMLDVGLYTTTGIIPNVKYFQLQNISYEYFPENYDEQLEYVRDGKIDFIVTAESMLEGKALLAIEDKYDLILEKEQIYEGFMYNYLLFKKKE